jgi:hypothetical protein
MPRITPGREAESIILQSRREKYIFFLPCMVFLHLKISNKINRVMGIFILRSTTTENGLPMKHGQDGHATTKNSFR